MNQLVPAAYGSPALVAAGARAQERFIEFFTANIRNRNAGYCDRASRGSHGSACEIWLAASVKYDAGMESAEGGRFNGLYG